ncbi:MAG: electron transport complex subunit RsxG [Arsenophonus sp.]|nr:MAG: electron transport complex subunit RsxG [Arsenophonus sp.]
MDIKNNNFKKKIQYNACILCIICIFFSGIISIIYTITQEKIRKELISKKKHIFSKIIPLKYLDNNFEKNCYKLNIDIKKNIINIKINSVYLAKNKNKIIAFIIESTTYNGYGGPIQLMIAIDIFGKILGIHIIEHHETPGLGDKIDIKISNWITQFINKKNIKKWKVKQQNREFTQITGATITTKAVLNVIQESLSFIQKNYKKIPLSQKCNSEL